MPDPTNPQSWNRYSYVGNNPLNYVDPSGHLRIIDDDENGNPIVDLPRRERVDRKLKDRVSGDENDVFDRDDRYGDINLILPTNIPIPTPPDEMTTVEKYGMGISVAITVVFVIVPIEAALVVLTFGAAGACGSGAVLGCLADIPLVAADIAVADFGVSLTVHAAESISSGYKSEFEWIIIPYLIDVFSGKEK